MSAMASGIIPPDLETQVDVGGAKTTQGDDLPIPAGLGGSGVDEMTFFAEYGHAIGGPSAKGQGDAGGLIDRLLAREARGARSARPDRCASSPDTRTSSRTAGSRRARRSSRCASRVRRTRPRSGGSASSTRTSTEETAQDRGHGREPHLRSGRPPRAGGRRELVAEHACRPGAWRSRRIPQLLTMDLGRGKILATNRVERGSKDAPTSTPSCGPTTAWAEWMKGSDWDTLREATTPGDFV